jgi:hypothetical protein
MSEVKATGKHHPRVLEGAGEMMRFNTRLYLTWLVIGAIPMEMFYLTTNITNPIIEGIIGLCILWFVLLVLCPIVEQTPLSSVFYMGVP